MPDSASSANADAPTTSLGSSTGEVERILVAHLLRHLAADQHRVGAAAEVLEHAELVVDLRAAGDQDERALDVAEQLAEMLELREQQQAGVRGQQVRDSLGRRVRAMRRAERVVHVEIAAVGELLRERRVVLRLAGVEARVLEHTQPLVREQLAQRGLDGRHRVLRAILLRLRPTEVRAHAHLGGLAVEQHASVGSDARMRVSSATLPSSSGTFRSERTSTVLPATSASRTERGRRIGATRRPRASSPRSSRRGRRDGSCSPTRCRTSRRP